VLQLNPVNRLGHLLLPNTRGREYVKFSCACTCILHSLRFLRREESCLGLGKFYNTKLRVEFVPPTVGVPTCRFCVHCSLLENCCFFCCRWASESVLAQFVDVGVQRSCRLKCCQESFGVESCTILVRWGFTKLPLEQLPSTFGVGTCTFRCCWG
jgi:hypothetical protein